MEVTWRKTQCPVSKILQRYIKELKLTVLLVFFYFLGRYLLGKPLLCAIVFVRQ